MSAGDCVFFLKGSCKAGSTCAFRHNPAVLAPGTKPCAFFAKGACKTGAACGFLHTKSSGSGAAAPSGAPASDGFGSSSAVRASVPCLFWMQGTCNKGASCDFSHDMGALGGAGLEAASAALSFGRKDAKPASGSSFYSGTSGAEEVEGGEGDGSPSSRPPLTLRKGASGAAAAAEPLLPARPRSASLQAASVSIEALAPRPSGLNRPLLTASSSEGRATSSSVHAAPAPFGSSSHHYDVIPGTNSKSMSAEEEAKAAARAARFGLASAAPSSSPSSSSGAAATATTPKAAAPSEAATSSGESLAPLWPCSSPPSILRYSSITRSQLPLPGAAPASTAHNTHKQINSMITAH